MVGEHQIRHLLGEHQDACVAEERLRALLDDGSLELISPLDDSGMLAAVGTVDGHEVVAFCSDATVMGGAMGDLGCRVVVDAYHRALSDRVPIIGLWHSGGARLAEGVLSLHAVGRIFQVMTQASGVIPQISVVLGPAAGGAAYGPALTDVVILGPEGRIFVTGPDVVRSVTGEDVDMLRLGGPEPHGRRSGVVHVLTETEEDALGRARAIASLLGAQGSLEDAAAVFQKSGARQREAACWREIGELRLAAVGCASSDTSEREPSPLWIVNGRFFSSTADPASSRICGPSSQRSLPSLRASTIASSVVGSIHDTGVSTTIPRAKSAAAVRSARSR